MKPNGVVLFRLANPLFVEPVLWTCRVAVKPQLRAIHRTSGAGLFHKGSGLQRNFVQKNTGKGSTLNECEAAFILTAEDFKDIFPLPIGDNEDFVGSLPLEAVFVLCVGQTDIRHNQVFYCAVHRLAANAKPLMVIAPHSIVDE